MADTSVSITKIASGNRLASASVIWAEVNADHTVTDEAVVIVTSTAAARAVTLPLLSAVPLGKPIVIVDGSGAAGTNNITVTAAGSNTINGAATIVISANYGTVTLYPTVADGWVTTVHEEAGSGGGGANALGTYIVKTAANKPTNAQVLASLATGIVKNTTTTGALSIATSADYVAPGSAPSFIAPTTIDGTGVASIPLLIKNGLNATGLELQVTGSAATALLLRNAAGAQKGAFGVVVASNDFTFNSLADDAVVVAAGTLWLAGNTAGGVKIHNATGNASAVFNDTSGVIIGWSSCNLQIASTGATWSHPANSSQQITFNQGNNIATSSDSPYLKATSTFAPTSGTATYELFTGTYTINQTGGANGTCTGLLITATETAVVGTHNLLDLRIGATSQFKVTNAGGFTMLATALATGATTGFPIIRTMAGTPSGAVADGAIVVDTTGSKIWARVGGAWKSVAVA